MGKIWTPESERSKDEAVVVRAEIVNAKYHPTEACIMLHVRTPDGESRVLPIYAKTFTFHGVPYDAAPQNVILAEMKKTEQLFLKRKGGFINVKMFKNQIELT